MPFDFSPSDDQALRGHYAYQDGLAAEDAVERAYLAKGYGLVARRWRGGDAEIDLIFVNDAGFVFVETKKARTHAEATHRLSKGQLQRICRAGELYAGRVAPGRLVDMRIDLATVDATGDLSILENISQY